MLDVRIEGSVVVIACALTVNLTALTLEQVLGKRRKVVADMCEQLAVRARQQAQAEEWNLIGAPAVESFLEKKLLPLAQQQAEHYNENAPLGAAIEEAVALSEILDGWPAELRAMAGALGVGAEALAQMSQVQLPEKSRVTEAVAEGLCALSWVRPSLSVNLSKCMVPPECLTVLGRGLATSVTSMVLAGCNIAKGGNDLSGLRRLCEMLRNKEHVSGLVVLDLAGNHLGPDAAELLGGALRSNSTLTTLR